MLHILRSVAALSLAFLVCVGAVGCAKKIAKDVQKQEEPKQVKSPASKAAADDVIAAIGNEVITAQEYKEEIALLPPAYRAIAASSKQQFIDSLINKRLLLMEANARHLEDNANVKKLFEKAKEEIMMQELIGIEITDKIKIGDEEIEKYYEANKQKYVVPAKIRISHILVDSEVVAQKVLSDLKNGADFALLAKEYSLDAATKASEGDLGYFVKGALMPELEEASANLKPGETSGAVKTSTGYHVIKVTDRKEEAARPLAEIKAEIENELFVEKQISLYDELMKKLKEGKQVTINSAVLDKISAE